MIPYHENAVLNFKDSNLLQFINCKLLRNHRFVDEHLWVENGRVINPEPVFFDSKRPADAIIDCKGAILAPGFIDIQINGGFGVDFSSDVDHLAKGLSTVAQGLVSTGVTSFCPTIISSTPAVYHSALSQYKAVYRRQDKEANVLGFHLEGPFINEEKKGAHPPVHLRDGFDNGFEDAKKTYGEENLDIVRMVTLAPELKNATAVIGELTKRGIKVSLGHSMASLTEGEEAVKNGASCLTHLFNAMLPFHHRDPGIVGLLTSKAIPKGRTLFYGVIADGTHTHDSALRIAHRTHPEGLILVTDAFAALGLAEGIHHLGDVTVELRGKYATVAGTGTLAGSISPLDYCVRHFMKAASCTAVEALECASLHPAQCLGIEKKKGSLTFGADADFVLLDDQLNVLATFIAGKRVWCKK